MIEKYKHQQHISILMSLKPCQGLDDMQGSRIKSELP
jgi:hypothetical protein